MNAIFQIDSDFPGGNIIVDSIEGDTVNLHQDLRDTMTEWFYWCFRIQGAGGRKLTFRFTQSRAIGARGPACSTDCGKNWFWLKTAAPLSNTFSYAFPKDSQEVRFSFGMPYQVEQWNRFVSGLSPSLPYRIEELCKSEKGRSVPFIRFGCIDKEPVHKILLTCRHHCCEMMASYSLEGLIAFVLGNPGDDAERLRKTVEFLAIPLMDIDGVEAGDQGKNRRPHDHNRDYGETCLYASVKALRNTIPGWANGKLIAALDLHCPWIDGEHNEDIYLVGLEEPNLAAEQREFSDCLEKLVQHNLPFSAANFLPFGTDWNKPTIPPTEKCFHNWIKSIPSIRLATGIEIPYASAGQIDVTAASARGFGSDLGLGLSNYLKERAK